MRVIYEKDNFSHTELIFKNPKALMVYEINLFHILSLKISCKGITALVVFLAYTHKNLQANIPSEQRLLYNNLLALFGEKMLRKKTHL